MLLGQITLVSPRRSSEWTLAALKANRGSAQAASAESRSLNLSTKREAR